MILHEYIAKVKATVNTIQPFSAKVAYLQSVGRALVSSKEFDQATRERLMVECSRLLHRLEQSRFP